MVTSGQIGVDAGPGTISEVTPLVEARHPATVRRARPAGRWDLRQVMLTLAAAAHSSNGREISSGRLHLRRDLPCAHDPVEARMRVHPARQVTRR